MDVDEVIRDLASQQYGVVSRRQLEEAGVTRSAVRHRVDSGMLEAASRRVLVLAGTPELAARAAMTAVLDAPPGAMLSHRSAAAWWGLPGFDLNGTIEVTVPRRGAPRVTEVARWHYQHPIPRDQVRVLKGITVTSPALTMMHLGAVCHLARVRRTVNNALGRGIVEMDELVHLRWEMKGSGRNGIGVLGQIVEEFGDDWVPTDSGVELRLGDLARAYGVPLEPQVWVGDSDARIGRADFRLKGEPRGLVELLSLTYHSMFLDRVADEERFRRMERAGFSVLTVWDTDVWNRPDEVATALVEFSLDLAARRLTAR